MEEINQDKKNNVAAVLGFIAFVIIVAIIIYFTVLKTPTPTIVIENDGVGETLKVEDNLEQINTQTVSDDSNFEIDSIEQELAKIIEEGDSSKCTSLSNESYEVLCENSFLLLKAKEEKDLTYCNQMQGEEFFASNCKFEVIFTQQRENPTLEICNQVNDEEIKKNCIYGYYIEKATQEKDISYCDESPLKNECENYYYLNTEFITNPDTFKCSKLNGEEEQKECVEIQNADKSDSEVFANTCIELKTTLIESCFKLIYEVN